MPKQKTSILISEEFPAEYPNKMSLSLHVHGIELSDEGLKEILSVKSELLTLELSKCPNLTYSALEFIAQCCPNLQTLALSELELIQPSIPDEIGYKVSFWKKISIVMNNLQYLTVRDCLKLTNLTLSTPVLQQLVIENCPLLQRINTGSQEQQVLRLENAIAYHHLISQGVAKISARYFAEAIADLDAAVRLNPEMAVAYYHRGSVKINLGHFAAAQVDFNEAIRINPDDASNYNKRSFVNSKLKNFPEALSDLNEFISRSPQYIMAYVNRGVVKMNLGQFAEAVLDFNKAIPLNINEKDIFLHRGYALYHLQKYSEAQENYQTVFRCNPDFAPVLLLKGLALAQGRGIPQDLVAAQNSFHQAKQAPLHSAVKYFFELQQHLAKQNNRVAQLLLGIIYDFGLLNITANKTTAIDYYQQINQFQEAWVTQRLAKLSPCDGYSPQMFTAATKISQTSVTSEKKRHPSPAPKG
jgi:tetratricopeptide (TPR) repeat protein